jgi:hypothetical protein
MSDRTITPNVASEIRALSDHAWSEFTATSPQGIDLVDEASVRRLIASRIRRAIGHGELYRGALIDRALYGL